MLRVLIIDDEILAITLLEKYIGEMDGVQIIGKYTWFEEGLESLKNLKPDVVFLDIEMPGLNGIGVAERILNIDDMIDIVFVTAYDQYALEAFRVHAVDYLLKPADKERLKSTLHKIMKRRKIDLPKLQESSSLHAQFIGNFVLYDKKGQAIKWRTKKVKELCAYLLYHETSVHRMQIIEDLWPDVPLEKAGTILHTTVYQLRKILKSNDISDPLPFVDERYSINIKVECNFKSTIQAIKKNSDDDKTILDICELAKRGYLSFEDYTWAMSRKEKIQEECKQQLDIFIEKYRLQTVKPQIWCSVLETLIELEPFLEKYYRDLIMYYIEVNEVKKAVAIFNNLKELLWKELGETPQKETIILIENNL